MHMFLSSMYFWNHSISIGLGFYIFFMLSIWTYIDDLCCNLSLKLTTKARACKVAGQEKKFESERKCERMNPHILNKASTLGVGVFVDSRMFREQLQG